MGHLTIIGRAQCSHKHYIILHCLSTGIATASGLAATTMICQLLKSGDHIVAMDDLYGGRSRQLTHVLVNYQTIVTLSNHAMNNV